LTSKNQTSIQEQLDKENFPKGFRFKCDGCGQFVSKKDIFTGDVQIDYVDDGGEDHYIVTWMIFKHVRCMGKVSNHG